MRPPCAPGASRSPECPRLPATRIHTMVSATTFSVRASGFPLRLETEQIAGVLPVRLVPRDGAVDPLAAVGLGDGQVMVVLLKP